MKAVHEKLVLSVQRMRNSPVYIIAIIVLAILIFAMLAFVFLMAEPDHSFQVECLQLQGREGDLVVVSGTGTLRPSVVTVISVVDETGKPVVNATVKITGTEGSAMAETNETGHVTISFIKTLAADEQTVFAGIKVKKNNFKTYDDDWFITIVRT